MSRSESRGRWQPWLGALVALGSLFTIGWTFVETFIG